MDAARATPEVASYICQAWRIFELKLETYPPRWMIVSSWFLLVIISFVIVADLKHWRSTRETSG